jgi:hypothetical protein
MLALLIDAEGYSCAPPNQGIGFVDDGLLPLFSMADAW